MMIIEQVYYGEQVGVIVCGVVQGDRPITLHDRLVISPTAPVHAVGKVAVAVAVKSIHRWRTEVNQAEPGQYVTFSVSVPDGVCLERGMTLSLQELPDHADETPTNDTNVTLTNHIQMTNVVSLREPTDSALGSVLLNGSKYHGQLRAGDCILVSQQVPVHRHSPIIFLSHDQCHLVVAYTT